MRNTALNDCVTSACVAQTFVRVIVQSKESMGWKFDGWAGVVKKGSHLSTTTDSLLNKEIHL